MGVGVGESESIEAVAIYQLVFLKVETDSCLSVCQRWIWLTPALQVLSHVG
jgi:hypothetical protein